MDRLKTYGGSGTAPTVDRDHCMVCRRPLRAGCWDFCIPCWARVIDAAERNGWVVIPAPHESSEDYDDVPENASNDVPFDEPMFVNVDAACWEDFGSEYRPIDVGDWFVDEDGEDL